MTPLQATQVSAAPRLPQQELTPVEAAERQLLRDTLRLRRSVDHFARAWYGGVGSLILTGVAAKLFHDKPGLLWIPVAFGVLSAMGWLFAVVFMVRSRRTARTEREMLARLLDLDARAPKPPELF